MISTVRNRRQRGTIDIKANIKRRNLRSEFQDPDPDHQVTNTSDGQKAGTAEVVVAITNGKSRAAHRNQSTRSADIQMINPKTKSSLRI